VRSHSVRCSSLKWINLSTLSSEVKVTTKIAGIVYNIQQLEEEIEMPDMEPMTLQIPDPA
jgi:hypothetical protein